MDATSAMNILFLRRKKRGDIGGLARFITELVSGFPPFDWKKPTHCIHATDATLLPLGVILKLLFRTPLTITAHGKDISWSNPVYQNIFNLCIPFVSAWIVDSTAAKPLLKQKGIRNIRIIPPGISIHHIPKMRQRKNQYIKKTVLTTVGNLVLRKGHSWFIEHVFTKLPTRFIYYIVGEGHERKRINRLIQRYQLEHRVFLFGRLSDQRLADIFAQTHLYIAPNQHIPGDFEGFGLAAGEAAAMGLPVLASRVDGLPTVIHHNKNGWLISPVPEAWRKAILSARRNPVASRYTLSRFSWKKTINEYSRLFEAVADKKK